MRNALLVAAVAAALYLPRLGSAPVYLAPDEVFIGLHAQSLATTGRDYGGRLLPLYIEYEYPVADPTGQRPIRHGWLPSIIYYAIAFVLLVVPISEAAIRVPTAVVGILDVVLMYFVGRRLFKNEALAMLGAVLLALTPAHFVHARFAMDYLYPVPFALAWLLGLLTYLDEGRESRLFLATLALGIGVFSYIAAALVMPMYLLITFGALARERCGRRAAAIAALGFLIPAALHLPWLVAHPSALTDILSKYGLDDSSRASIGQSLRGFVTFHAIGDQVSRLWIFFDPRFLFFDGPMEPMYSTRAVGVFLVPIAIFLLVGLRAILRGRVPTGIGLVSVAMLTTPLAATLVRVPDAIYRALELLPFVILVSVAGVRQLWSSSAAAPRRSLLFAAGFALVSAGAVYAASVLATQSRMPGAAMPLIGAGLLVGLLGLLSSRLTLGRMIAIGLLAVAPLQFLAFYVDYFGDYQRRSSMAFSGNIRGALEEAIREAQESRAPTIYLGRVGPYGKGGIYWNFYLAKHRLDSWKSRTIDAGQFDADRVAKLEPGSVIVNNAGEGQTQPAIDRLVASGELSKTVIKEPDGTPTFVVLRRISRS